MSTQLLLAYPANPDGKRFRVSTVRTFSGGGADNRPFGSPFSDSDYADETPWPYESMVFPEASSVALYHEAHDSELAARERHQKLVGTVERGLEFHGDTVEGPYGVPTLTAAEWLNR